MRTLPLLALTALAATLSAPALSAAAQPMATAPQTDSATQTTATQQPSFAQRPTPASAANTLSVNARLVIVPTIVRDKHGALVQNLGKSDFNLQVDGKSQTIRYFDHDADVPLTLGLLIDTSRSQAGVLDSERSASVAFLDKMLTPATATRASDKAFIIQFAGQVELLQDVTDSRPRLQAALQQVSTEPSSSQTTDSSGHAHGGTALYDAVFLAADEITAKLQGRRALILLTDGVDRNSKERIGDAIEAAQRADTIIYAIYFKGQEEHQNNGNHNYGGHHGGGFPGGGGYPGMGYPGGGYPGGGGYPNGGGQSRGGAGGQRGSYASVDGKKILERICGETGGRVFELSQKLPLDQIYAQIGEELRSEYRLGFTPSADAAKDGYHEINLTMTGEQAKNKLAIQTRDGYYTGQ